MRKTICLDFDGVIHSYASGWKGITNIPDAPTIGCYSALKGMIDNGWEVVIHSTRCRSWKGRRAVRKWMQKYNLPSLKVVKHKPPAFVTLDDRAITFNGNWADAITDIGFFESWIMKRDKRRE